MAGGGGASDSRAMRGGILPVDGGVWVLTGCARSGMGGKINFGVFYLGKLLVAVELGFRTGVGYWWCRRPAQY